MSDLEGAGARVQEWDGFEGRLWKERIDVRDFIQSNYHQYNWGEEFLASPTERTKEAVGAVRGII